MHLCLELRERTKVHAPKRELKMSFDLMLGAEIHFSKSCVTEKLKQEEDFDTSTVKKEELPENRDV